ncbi:beta-lactamase/transpeptidase-like protein [Clavulina sp. PMI_390]|nr:beta-lactamase/transpeptidase-like protein [Clavulina sp. PMI_390]
MNLMYASELRTLSCDLGSTSAQYKSAAQLTSTAREMKSYFSFLRRKVKPSPAPSTSKLTTPATHAAIQKLFDDATVNSLAPGYQFVVFDREAVLVNGVSGYSDIPSSTTGEGPDAPSKDGVKMRPDHIHWMMSASKLALSVVSLVALEQGLTSNGMTMADLDNHEKLVEILPEFKLGGGSWVTKIIEGWEDGHDEQGRKIPRFRDTTVPVTLRMLFTHTSGQGIIWDSALNAEMMPALVEPGTEVKYSCSADWLAQWLVRSTGRNLRELINTYIVEPLGISVSEFDCHLRDNMIRNMSGVYSRTEDTHNRFKRDDFPRELFTCEGTPPPGYAYLASGPIMSSTQAYSVLLQAALKHDTRILSEETWSLAEGDALAGTNIKIPVPRVPTVLPTMACELKYFATPVDPAKAGTMNLLNTELALGPTESGRPAGSYGWSGLLNSYYMIDPINGFGYMWSSQCGPWAAPEALVLRDNLEKILYRALTE